MLILGLLEWVFIVALPYGLDYATAKFVSFIVLCNDRLRLYEMIRSL